MLDARPLMRYSAALLSCALALVFAPAVPAQTINVSLNVHYNTPTNVLSGGFWELVAKSSDNGIAGLSVWLTNVNNTVVQEAPRATVNGSDPAGFSAFDYSSSTGNLVIGQEPLIPPLTGGDEENVFYGVGTLPNGAPNYLGKPVGQASIGPQINTLTNLQDIPWAFAPDFRGESVWNTAALMASGTFAVNVTPGFATGSAGDVFNTLPPDNFTFGNIVPATTFTAEVRTNYAPSADYNHNGVVDAADYVVWRKSLNQSVTPGTLGDGTGDGTVNMADYNLWRLHFGNPSGAGSGGSLSTGMVPEPASCALIAIGAMLALATRRVPAKRKMNK